MTEPDSTQRDMRPAITSELEAAGFEDAEEIGRGGFGVVYRCAQRSLDRTVAIKVLSADLDQENIERFLREEHAMGRLSGHPNIVDILQVDVTVTGRPFIVMPFHARGSLDGLIRSSGPLAWTETVRIGVKIAGALESAHRVGILHRDVKPANILLTAYGEPQLTDFGIARVPGSFETSTNAIAGSPAFTAPEVLKGVVPTAASDVYGLGATLFCLVTGHAAFERRTGEKVVAQFLRITSEPVPDLRALDIPPDVAAAIEAAMAPEPADRPASAAEFGELLQEVESQRSIAVDEMALVDDSEQGPTVVHPRRDPTRTTGRSRRTRASTTPPSASTKYRPPSPTRMLLTRERLIDVLRAGQRRRLVVIHAPAGFGKSTLAAQWRDVLSAEGVAVAWLSIDDDDNNVVWFLTHVIEAVRRARPDLAADLSEALEEQAEEAQRYVLTALIDEIHERGQKMALIIDDWHRITDEGAIAAMDFLQDNGCHHLMIIVTSRSRSGLPLSRMRVRDELVEIDSDALRLDADESKAFLVGLNRLPLADADVDELRRSTEGWAAALQLVSLSLRGRDDPADLIARMAGQHHAIGEYLVENVLDTLDAPMLEFLLSICVTERVNGELASVLAEVDNGHALLAEAEDRDLFLRRIDEEPGWFRIQLLFAEFLRRRLEREQPARLRALHLRASLWFAEHQRLREAVDHALAAADMKRAMDLVEASGMELIEGSRLATLLGLVAKLPAQQVFSRSKLMMAVARANVTLHRPAAARSALDRISSMLDRSSPTDTTTHEQRIEAAVVDAVAQVGADRVEGVEELVSECLSNPEGIPAWVVTDAANAMSFVLIYRFEYAEARSQQEWAAPYRQRSSGPLGAVYGHCYAGIAAREQLDLASAAKSFEKALQVAETAAGGHTHAMRVAAAMLGEFYYERGDLDSAERLLDEAYRLGAELGAVDFMIAAYVTGARVKAVRGDLDAAAQRLTAGEATATTLSLARLGAAVEHERVRLGLPARKSAPAAQRHAQHGIAVVTAELEEASAIRGLLAAHTLDGDDRASARARALAESIRTHDRPRAQLHGDLMVAACLFAAGWIDEAKDALVPVVVRCAELGITRVLLDGGPQIVPLLEALRDDERAGRWRPQWQPVPKLFLAELTGPA